MTEPRNDAALEPTLASEPPIVEAATPSASAPGPAVRPVEPPPPGGRSELEPITARGALPAFPGTPPVTTAVPVPAGQIGRSLPGVELAQHPRRRGDSFGWPANAAPGKPEGEVDTRP